MNLGRRIWKKEFEYIFILELNLDFFVKTVIYSIAQISIIYFFFFIKFLIQYIWFLKKNAAHNVISCSYVILYNKYPIQKVTRKKTAEQSFYLKFRKTTISTIPEMDRYH